MKKVLSLVLALVLVLGVMSFASADEEKIELKMYSFTNELQGVIEKYYLPTHPNVVITADDWTIIPTDGDQYLTKVDTLLGSSADSDEAPDLFAIEAGFVKHYIDSPFTAPLADIGFTDADYEGALDVMLKAGQDSNGVQKGLAWQSTPGALFYRASLAEKYLGVKTPEEMQALVADWDLFVETAQKLYDASEGACKMVTGSGDLWNVYQYQRTQPWVVDGKLVIDDELLDYEELCKTLYENKLTQQAGAWGEVWFAGMQGATETLCYFLPTWGLHYTLKPNCVAGGFSTTSAEEEAKLQKLSEENNGTYGDWRMIAGPCAYSWGGTWIGVNAGKLAKASDAKKAAMYDLIKFVTLDQDFLYQYAIDSGDFVGNKAVVDKYLAEGERPNPFLGGQDHYKLFADYVSLTNVDILNYYDNKINDAWSKFVTTPYETGEKTLEEAIEGFKKEVAAAITDITVE